MATPATRLEIAKRLYGRGSAAAVNSYSSSVVGGVTGGISGSLGMRYGTATLDSTADGWVTVHLDNTPEDETVECICDSPIKQGDRVAVLVTDSGQLKAIPIGDRIVGMVQQDVAQQIQEAGQEILDEVNGEMDAWKADHQLTDADITHQIEQSVSGATETWEGKLSSVENDIETNYALKTELTTGINGLKSEIEENYTTSEGVTNEINTAISQASGQIESTVEQNVMNSVGDTFATKTELTQTSTSLQLNITQAVNKANDAASDASNALDAAQEVEAYFRADSTGLTVGRTSDDCAAKMGSNGTFSILDNGNTIFRVSATSSEARIETPYTSQLFLGIDQTSGITVSDYGVDISTMTQHFGIDSLNAVEVYGRTAYSSTGSGTTSLGRVSPASVQFVVLYYHGRLDAEYGSTKVRISLGETVHATLSTATSSASLMTGSVESITLYLSSSGLKITRNQASRFNINSGGAGHNGTYSNVFYIDYVTFCA